MPRGWNPCKYGSKCTDGTIRALSWLPDQVRRLVAGLAAELDRLGMTLSVLWGGSGPVAQIQALPDRQYLDGSGRRRQQSGAGSWNSEADWAQPFEAGWQRRGMLWIREQRDPARHLFFYFFLHHLPCFSASHCNLLQCQDVRRNSPFETFLELLMRRMVRARALRLGALLD